jgi:hypothetical protein
MSAWQEGGKMTNDVKSYFFKKYKNSHIRVVPGHWPDFKSKKEVNNWFLLLESMVKEAESEKQRRKQN